MAPTRIGPLALILLSSIFAFAANSGGQATTTQAPVSKDTQAVSVLTQALNAAGGLSAIGAIQDFTATGNITYYWDQPVQGTVTVRGRGLHEFRLDATLADGVHSWFVNSSTSFQENPDGSTLPLPSQNIVKPANLTFPLLHLVMAIQDAAVTVSYGGLVTHDGQQVHDILIQRTFPQSSDPLGALGRITKAHIFIDPNALTIQSILDTAYRRDLGPGEFSHEMQFSNYQAVNGVFVPMSVTEFISNQQTETIQLTQINFNTGLADSDFEQ
jgi:hypothetical protein